MVEGNMSQESRLKNTEKTRNYFVEEIEQNELMSNKHKKVCVSPNRFEDLLFKLLQMYFNFSFDVFDWYSHRN